MIRRRLLLAALPALAAAPLCAPALAQGTGAQATGGWPNRPIRLVVPYPPGGASDIAGRLQALVLSEGLGVPCVVDNRAGAGGTIGTAHVAQSAPDGYTIMMASPSSHLGAPLLFKTPGYEGVDDFTAIATFATGTAMVCVNPRLPITNIQELIAYAKANPGKLNYGSAGAGGANHMLGVLFMQRTGTELTHVPYRGAAPALADLIAGNIQVVFDSFAGVIPAVRGGQVRALAVTSAERWPLAPEFPTVQEQGVPDYDLPSFSAVMGPKGIPEPIVNRMNAVINEGLKNPQLIERLAANGNAPYPSTPAEFATMMRAQRATWRALVQATGLQPQ
ncbi:Bug family tripartite tricarboxylate transporter substrate binding protein [Falsiroseomonas sp.]|uniref:Bug family tripartite tricarboxylate transporter substrate binding protein n=1 Tax=Falsiroseomonas sp. TaxID=2870721 RepID=UPI003564C63B